MKITFFCVFRFFFVCIVFFAVCVCEHINTNVYFIVATTLKISSVCANKVNKLNIYNQDVMNVLY